ncbi:MAG: deoxyribose-phosphate aldolase [Phycisphaerales bacterium]|nr:deoxyribose-phosphate aldolase [Phycisphaerales bacterium]
MNSPTVDKVMLEGRAASFTTRSIKGPSKLAGLRLALSMLDLTTLEGKDTPEKVRALCHKAMRPGAGTPAEEAGPLPSVAAVCVYPTFVRLAKEELARSGVKVAAVATGFPSGQYPLDVRIADCISAVRDGADEIDMVINRGAFLSGRYGEVGAEISEFRAACERDGRGVHLKVILETGELETYDNVRRASDLAIEAGADVIKTSTGKVQPAATMPVTLVMLEAIRDHFLATGRRVGMKPAGGISTAKLALHYLVMVKETLGSLPGGDAWLSPGLFRFGASTLANDLLRQIAWVHRGSYAAGYEFAES